MKNPFKEAKRFSERNNFVSLTDDLTNAVIGTYKREAEPLMSYGVPFLNAALRGLANDEVVLLGAPSGVGKTEFCIRLALSNIQLGFNVHFFSLESSENEIALRYLYMRVASMYFKDPNRPKLPIKLNYLDFYYGAYGSLLDDYYNEVMKNDLSKLKIFYKGDDFGIDNFLNALDGISAKTDLIILDHLHYFDMESDNENKEMKEIIKKIRVRSQILKKPIILVAHLRKKNSFIKRLVAGLEDFHGSSDIGKISTTAIVLGPGKALGQGKYETFFRIVKCRKDGSLKYYTAKCLYDSNRNAYADEYILGNEKHSKEEGCYFEPITDNNQLPYWAKRITVDSHIKL